MEYRMKQAPIAVQYDGKNVMELMEFSGGATSFTLNAGQLMYSGSSNTGDSPLNIGDYLVADTVPESLGIVKCRLLKYTAEEFKEAFKGTKKRYRRVKDPVVIRFDMKNLLSILAWDTTIKFCICGDEKYLDHGYNMLVVYKDGYVVWDEGVLIVYHSKENFDEVYGSYK